MTQQQVILVAFGQVHREEKYGAGDVRPLVGSHGLTDWAVSWIIVIEVIISVSALRFVLTLLPGFAALIPAYTVLKCLAELRVPGPGWGRGGAGPILAPRTLRACLSLAWLMPELGQGGNQER